MIVAKLQGGLGNQMLQFATALGQGKQVYLDLDFLKTNVKSSANFTARNFELDLFPNLEYKEISNFQRRLFLSRGLIFKWQRKILDAKVVFQEAVENVEIPVTKNVYLDGYFHSEKYFRHIRSEILRVYEFPPLDSKNEQVRKKIEAAGLNSVSVHIRRGDYLKPEVAKYHGILPLEYYEQAIEILRSTLVDIKIFIFSDDEVFTRAHFGHLDDVFIVSGNETGAWKDMALMSFCAHHVVANSSFSWWGAWLSKYSNGIHIAPREWLNSKVVDFRIDDIVPTEWRKI